MALTISGTSNGKLGNLSLSASTGDILDSANTTFFGTDVWYITADQAITAGTSADLDANWVRLQGNIPTGDAISGLNGFIGNAMTESSGKFTFPSTGIWRVDASLSIQNTGTDTWYPQIIHTNDDFTTEGRMAIGLSNAFAGVFSGRAHFEIFDIQDTSNYKIRFSVGSLTAGNVEGDTDFMRSWVAFTKLGET